jgi:hypothetical protein
MRRKLNQQQCQGKGRGIVRRERQPTAFSVVMITELMRSMEMTQPILLTILWHDYYRLQLPWLSVKKAPQKATIFGTNKDSKVSWPPYCVRVDPPKLLAWRSRSTSRLHGRPGNPALSFIYFEWVDLTRHRCKGR